MAIAIYRERFKPSAQLAKPYVLVGMNVIAAESDDEARRLATTQQMSFANIFRGTRTLSQPPIDDIESYWSPQEKMQASQMLACSVIGSLETVSRGTKDMIGGRNVEDMMQYGRRSWRENGGQ